MMKMSPMQISLCKSTCCWKGTEIQERIAREAMKEYHTQYGTDQSFERMMERGGLADTEIMTLLYSRCLRLQGEEIPKDVWF